MRLVAQEMDKYGQVVTIKNETSTQTNLILAIIFT